MCSDSITSGTAETPPLMSTAATVMLYAQCSGPIVLCCRAAGIAGGHREDHAAQGPAHGPHPQGAAFSGKLTSAGGQRAGATKSSSHLTVSSIGHLSRLLMTLTSVCGMHRHYGTLRQGATTPITPQMRRWGCLDVETVQADRGCPMKGPSCQQTPAVCLGRSLWMQAVSGRCQQARC